MAVLELDDAVGVVDHGADDPERVGHDFGVRLRDADEAVRVALEAELVPRRRPTSSTKVS